MKQEENYQPQWQYCSIQHHLQTLFGFCRARDVLSVVSNIGQERTLVRGPRSVPSATIAQRQVSIAQRRVNARGY